MLRGARRRWWKPVLSLLLAAVAIVVGSIVVLGAVILLGGAVQGVPDLEAYIDRATSFEETGPVSFLALNLSLAILIPISGLTIWAVHGVRPGYLSSVAGGLRWRWLLRCLLVLLPLWLVYIAVGVLIDPEESGRPPYWGLLLVLVVLTTPLQAAGEEYLFRGFLLLNLGAWFARPVAALVVPAIVSAGLFAAAHGSPNVWVLADLVFFALAATVMTWRTGGLEAGIVLHAVNNSLLFFAVILFGGWKDAFVNEETTSTAGAFAISAALQAAAVALVLWQARRIGVDCFFRPAPRHALSSASAGFVAVHGGAVPAEPPFHPFAGDPGPGPGGRPGAYRVR